MSDFIAGFVICVWGVISILSPSSIQKFRQKVSKLYGAKFIPSKKTLRIQRLLGVIWIVLGLLILLNIV